MSLLHIARYIYDVLAAYKEQAPSYEPPGSFEEVPFEIDILKDIITVQSTLNTILLISVDADTKYVLANVKFYYPVPRAIRVDEPPHCSNNTF